MIDKLIAWYAGTSSTEMIWIAVGLFAQALFMMRFVVQWIASERIRRSIVPEAFWYFSIGGGLLLLAYSIYRVDPVYMLGQALGLIIYIRNIYFVWTHKNAGGASADEA
ncbi:MAG TPA: lipid-A-disaccharide synthase N-terminal domain-containing protein [Azospirillum sp.]|nr:lipid-A-disaccharide synthase N-terminal domain-containing protein [Azospirillum sp.]